MDSVLTMVVVMIQRQKMGLVSTRKELIPKSPPAIDADLKRELDIQRDLIGQLRQELSEKEARIILLEQTVIPRPASRERLPPVNLPSDTGSSPN